jgi:hypothetical protein
MVYPFEDKRMDRAPPVLRDPRQRGVPSIIEIDGLSGCDGAAPLGASHGLRGERVRLALGVGLRL